MLYAVLYVCVCCFVVRGCGVSRRYMFAIVICLVLLMCTLTNLSSVLCNGRRYVCCGECYVGVGLHQQQPTFWHQTDTACSWLVCHSRGDCANGIHVPAAWLAERLLLVGDIESNQGPKPTLKILSHTRTQPPHSPSTVAH